MSIAAEFVGVTKEYARDGAAATVALGEISLQIPAQEIFCIVGPSGCGKTTLLNIAAGFIRPSTGYVRIGDAQVDGAHGRSAFTFQTDAVFPWMTVAENVGYGLRWNGTPAERRNEIVQKYLAQVDLTRFASHWPRELSGGMRKRVDLARAFAIDPEVLLLDEPFGSLDSLTRAAMQQLLLNMWRIDRKTLVVVTHDVEEAVYLGSNVAVMSKRPGRIEHIFRIPFAAADRTPQLKLDAAFLSLRRDILAVLEALD